jgi:hypothetical protein
MNDNAASVKILQFSCAWGAIDDRGAHEHPQSGDESLA